jgi:hypothetical protein
MSAKLWSQDAGQNLVEEPTALDERALAGEVLPVHEHWVLQGGGSAY